MRFDQTLFDNYVSETCVATMVSKKRECTCVICDKLIFGTVVCCSTCKNHSGFQIATDLAVARFATLKTRLAKFVHICVKMMEYTYGV